MSPGERGGPDTPRPGVEIVLRRLSVTSSSHGHWKALCPCHGDTVASLYIDVKPRRGDGLAAAFFHCKGCGATGDDVLVALGLTLQRQRIYYEGNGLYLSRPPKYVENLTEAYVEKTAAYLLDHPDRLAYVTETRGVSLAVVRRERIGYDEGRERWTVPIYSGGRLVNVRRYDPNSAEGRPKMRNAAGHGSPARLYVPTPRRRRLTEAVFVCEGEWDALVATGHGLRTATGTHGADTWLPEWSRLMKGRDVAFVYDCDKEGRIKSVQHAADVARVARSVRVLELDPARDDGWDVSDWFAQGRTARDLLTLADSVEPLGESGGGRRGVA